MHAGVGDDDLAIGPCEADRKNIEDRFHLVSVELTSALNVINGMRVYTNPIDLLDDEVFVQAGKRRQTHTSNEVTQQRQADFTEQSWKG